MKKACLGVAYLCSFLLVLALCLELSFAGYRLATKPMTACGKKLAIGAVPMSLGSAILSQEDAAFFYHRGVNFKEVFRSLKYNLYRGKIIRGASTIEMQLASLCYFPEKTLSPFHRKIREFIYAPLIDLFYSKADVLRAYLTSVPLLADSKEKGFQVASDYYFRKSLGKLTPDEEWALVLTLRSARLLNPVNTDNGKKLPWRIERQFNAAKKRMKYMHPFYKGYFVDIPYFSRQR